MSPPRKRQADAAGPEPVAKRRSARQAQRISEAAAPASAPNPGPSKLEADGARSAGAKKGSKQAGGGVAEDAPTRRVAKSGVATKPKAMKREATKAKSNARAKKDEEEAGGRDEASEDDPDFESIPTRNPEVERHEGVWYWLMKAEPETRIENGVDVSFSIDDLRAKEVPEPWDGIRSYAARNNMRAMNAGDKVFFYHSNCKEPGIVGIMEVVKEFSEDTTARRPGTAYYDPASTKEKPRWGLVHVKFEKKFAVPIFLKELKAMAGSLEDMQMLKQSRLSVSRVGPKAWEYLCGVADRKAEEAGLEHEVD